ncbi:O-antigen ligase family protein [Mariniradius sediminis]|uniref:O-antigen ligase family protein n=1 Tax=Mariniradius sediminis TaxID=2909237 RepID=UPI001F1D206E|nr:O-antigen ligase family protein [Mariniradius sediminis]
MEVVTLFLLIGVIPEIYKKYPRDVVFKEVSFSAILILVLFIVNALFSTLFKFNPGMMYGISGGVLFGKIIFANFNIMPLACYVVFQRAIKDKKPLYLLVFLITVFLVLLSLRRTVMLLTILGAFVSLVNLVEFKNLKKLLGLVGVISIVTLVVITSTGFLGMLKERYELRNLDDKSLEEEQRIQEIGLVYNDLFVYYDYNPWFGFRLFDAKGNYGKGVFGDRNLHTDLTVLVHSGGFFGLFLYLSMVCTVFLSVWRRTSTKFDYMQFFFILLVFSIFFVTGRFNNVQSSIMIYLILCLPFALDEIHSGRQKKVNFPESV